jgi:hypothetical protein
MSEASISLVLPRKSTLRFPKSKMNVIVSKPVSTAKKPATTTCGSFLLPQASKVGIARALSVTSPLRLSCLRQVQLTFLDSNFNLPPDVTTEFDVKSSKNVNIQPLSANNNPQAGGLAPEAFKDKNLDSTADPDAVSGYINLQMK